MAKRVTLKGSYSCNPFEVGIDTSSSHLSATRVIKSEYSYRSFIHEESRTCLTVDLPATLSRKDYSVDNMYAYLQANPSLMRGSSQQNPLVISFAHMMAHIGTTAYKLVMYQRRMDAAEVRRQIYPDTFKEPIDITREGSFAAFPYRSHGQFIIFIRPWNSFSCATSVRPHGLIRRPNVNSIAGQEFEKYITDRNPSQNNRMLYIVTEPQLTALPDKSINYLLFGELDAVQEPVVDGDLDLRFATEVKTSKNDETLAEDLVVLQHVTCNLLGIPLIVRAEQHMVSESVVRFENIRYHETSDVSAFLRLEKKKRREAVNATHNFDSCLNNIMSMLCSRIMRHDSNTGGGRGWIEVMFSAAVGESGEVELETEWKVHKDDVNPLCGEKFLSFLDRYFLDQSINSRTYSSI